MDRSLQYLHINELPYYLSPIVEEIRVTDPERVSFIEDFLMANTERLDGVTLENSSVDDRSPGAFK